MDDLDFRNIPGYSGVYQITRQGVVRSNGRDCVVRNVKRRDGAIRDVEIWHRKTKILNLSLLSANRLCICITHMANARTSMLHSW